LGTRVDLRISPYVAPTEAPIRTVDNLGFVDGDGHRVWDWSQTDEQPEDRSATLRAEPIADKWFASAFPEAGFVSPLDAAGKLYGVYSFDESALKLYGSASTEEAGPEGKTLLVYDVPVELFRFPLQVGKSWSQSVKVDAGIFHNAPLLEDQEYEITVASAGELRLPDFTFSQVLRVNTKVITSFRTGTTTKIGVRQTLFLFECFATDVARSVSPQFYITDEMNTDLGPNFTVAQEVRRLAPFE